MRIMPVSLQDFRANTMHFVGNNILEAAIPGSWGEGKKMILTSVPAMEEASARSSMPVSITQAAKEDKKKANISGNER
jgi:hypothetical protein